MIDFKRLQPIGCGKLTPVALETSNDRVLECFSWANLMNYKILIQLHWLVRLNKVLNREMLIKEISKVDLTRIYFETVTQGESDESALAELVNYAIKKCKWYSSTDKYTYLTLPEQDMNNMAFGMICRNVINKLILPAEDEVIRNVALYTQGLADYSITDDKYNMTTVGRKVVDYVVLLKDAMEKLKKIRPTASMSSTTLTQMKLMVEDSVCDDFIAYINSELDRTSEQQFEGSLTYLFEIIHEMEVFASILRDLSSLMKNKPFNIWIASPEEFLCVNRLCMEFFSEERSFLCERYHNDGNVKDTFGFVGTLISKFLTLVDSFNKAFLYTGLKCYQSDNSDWRVFIPVVRMGLEKAGVYDPDYAITEALSLDDTVQQNPFRQFIKKLGSKYPSEGLKNLNNKSPRYFVEKAADETNEILKKIGYYEY